VKIQDIQFILDKMPQDMRIHANNTACLAFVMGKAINCSFQEMTQLWFAGLLHESGKLLMEGLLPYEVPKELSKMTQRSKNKKHILFTLALFELCESLKEFKDVKNILIQTFENVDGTGEPSKIIAEEIDTLSKVVRICSEYDKYRLNGLPHDQTCKELKSQANKIFPPKIIMPFIKAIVMSGLHKEYTEENHYEIGGAPDFDIETK